ncbi:MAG: hypothetical protein ACJ79H_17910 [Myxococcales bacterium]
MIAALTLAAAAAAPAGACALLSAGEIRRVQGEEPKETKPSERQAGGLVVQQCFYLLPDFSRSVSLEVTRGEKVRDLWNERFGEKRGSGEKEREAGREDAEREERPERVRGIGEQAFWTGNPRLGGLYVLRKGAMLRLSVGGNDPKAKKVRRLTSLARFALRRM